MNLLAIDPGETTCGVVQLVTQDDRPPIVPWFRREVEQDELKSILQRWRYTVVVEWLVSYGNVAGETTLRTARMCGKIDAWYDGEVEDMTRPDVKLVLCQSRSAKTSNVSEAIKVIYRLGCPQLGGGKNPVAGTKKEPGPLFGIALSNHEGAALALGLAWLRKKGAKW